MVKLKPEERARMLSGLRNNVEQGSVLLMDRDTSFVGEAAELPQDTQVISAIKDVPNHY